MKKKGKKKNRQIKFIYVLMIIVVLCLTIGVVASNSNTTMNNAVGVKSVKLNKTSVSIKVGSSVALSATITPSNATNKKVTWTSSNTKVAKVDSKGKVTGTGTGIATITATVGGKKVTSKVVSTGYIITQDTKITGLKNITNYNSETLRYRIAWKNNDVVSLIWVMDANKQFNSALPKLGKLYAPADILSKEIKNNKYEKKGMVAVNGGPFWDGWGDSPCSPFILNKGKIIRDIENKNYNKPTYKVIGITKEGQLKAYSFGKNNYTQNKNSKNQMIKDGVRNSFTVFGSVIDTNGKIWNDNVKNRRTVLCQVDNNNFVIFSGNSTFKQIGTILKNSFKCKVAYTFDGGASQALYYKSGSSSTAKKFYSGRDVADMMYFVEG